MGCNAWNHPADCDCGWGGDTGGGGGGGWGGFVAADPGPRPSEHGRWGRYEAARFESYTIPNARCPVCHAKVFFYQSEYGGRVFFDPPLGPPWPKHPCTDSGRTPTIRPRANTPKREAPSALNDGTTAAGSSQLPARSREKSLDTIRRSGWHPLLEIKVRKLDRRWRSIEGFDAVEEHRCLIVTDANFEECLPTFVRVDEPRRITCTVEQLQGTNDGGVRIERARSWFGVGDLDGARTAKAARSGDAAAMRRFAQAQSYRHLGRDNRISDVPEFVDLPAALYWFDKAGSNGAEEARLEAAYLRDLLDHDENYRKWRKNHPKKPLPGDLREPLSGTLAHAVCIRASERFQNLKDLVAERQELKRNWMDKYYIREMEASELYLKEVANRAPRRLRRAILAFLDRTQTPPFNGT